MSRTSGSQTARPFLKWAGGKGQLLGQLQTFFPEGLRRGEIRRYVEPFIGSGAVFLWVRQNCRVQDYLLSDANAELILVYQVLRDQVDSLVATLADLQDKYLGFTEPERRAFYYELRERYNGQRHWMDGYMAPAARIERASQLLFLNRTGYNGLFRLNASGKFNVPFGRYANPRLVDPDNLRAVSRLLQGVAIRHGDFTEIKGEADQQTFVYFDPPYRPVSKTARFTSYSAETFGDEEQLRLAELYRRLDVRGAKLMLSNSDPQYFDPADDFLVQAYHGFRIERVQARRNINSRAGKRGPVSELLILNYWL